MIGKLLVITQKVDRDDEVLGFFFGWLEALASRCDELTVICLERGAGSLPANVRVFSLGKESRPSRARYIFNFYKYIFNQWNHYDEVFIHMNQEYALMAGWLWWLGGKKVALWRNHARGSWLTAVAVFLSNRVFCTSPSSYTARFRKTRLMPVGVDTNLFKPNPVVPKMGHSILFLARMAPVKRPDSLIAALGVLSAKGISFSAHFYGDPLPKDKTYYESLKTTVRTLGLGEKIFFYSGVPNTKTPQLYHAHSILVNLTPPGSFDKTIMEALACGMLVLTANTGLAKELPNICIVPTTATPEALATALEKLLDISSQEYATLVDSCRQFVQYHSLTNLLDRLGAEWGEQYQENVTNLRGALRYLCAGVTGLAVNVITIFSLTHFLHVWYLVSSAVAFSVALVVSFTLQKFWTFKNRRMDVAGRQFLVYLSISLCNLLLNSLLVYSFTSLLGIWYVGSQIISAGLIGVSSFFLYRAFVFSAAHE